MPARLALDLALESGQLGYWNPQRVSGVDGMATLPAELDSLLFIALPGWLAYGLFMWLQRFVAGYFTFRLLKESLGLELWPALYAGLAYTLYAQYTQPFMGSFTLYDGLGLPGIPFVLWVMVRLGATSGNWSYLYAVGLGVLFAMTSHYALAPFVVACLFLWFLFVPPRSRPKLWIALFLFVVGWSLVELPVLRASFSYALFSHRADKEMIHLEYKGLLRAARFIYALLRLNVVPWGLAFVGLVVSRGWDRRLVSLLGSALLCFGFILGYPLIYTVLDRYLGFLSGFQFDRIYLLIPFLASVSGGVGIHLIMPTLRARKWHLALSGRTSRRYSLSFQIILFAAAIGMIVLQSVNTKLRELDEFLDGSCFAALYQHPDLQRLAQDSGSPFPFRVATITDFSGKSVQHPAHVWAYGLESVDGYVGLYPQRYQDYWEQVIAPLIGHDQKRYDYFHYWGNRVYLFDPATGFPQSEVDPKDYYDLELLSLSNVRYIISSLPLRDQSLALLPSDVRDEQLMWSGRSGLGRLPGILIGDYPGIPLYIYENRQVLPRFFLTNGTRVFDEPAQLLMALGQASHDDLRSTAYLERVDAFDLPLDRLGKAGGAVYLRDYSSDRIALDVRVESSSILVATNNYSPYWQAQIDDVTAAVFPVDHAFQGIYVEEGRHQVVLVYRPPYAVRLGPRD